MVSLCILAIINSFTMVIKVCVIKGINCDAAQFLSVNMLLPFEEFPYVCVMLI